MVLLLLLVPVAAASTAHAAEVLRIPFDDPAAPFLDHSPSAHPLTLGTFNEGPIVGQGVAWSDASPSPAGGGYAVFDGGSYIELPASEDFFFAAYEDLEDFTIRFWFRSSGIDRGAAFGNYRYRQHALGFGVIGNSGTSELGYNLDAAFDDPNSGGRGIWTYWKGGGSHHVRTAPGTSGLFTDGQWHHYWLVGRDGRISLYVGDGLDYALVDATLETDWIGSPNEPNYLGRGTRFQWYYFGWQGDLDHVEVLTHAEYPFQLCP